MFDINWIKSNLDVLKESLHKRNSDIDVEKLLHLDEKRRECLLALQKLQQERNEKSKAIGFIKDKVGTEFLDAKKQVSAINDRIVEMKSKTESIELEFYNLLGSMPNVLEEDVPFGKDEKENVVVSTYGIPKKFIFNPKPHFELGENLGMMDFEQSAKVSGSRFVTLKGELSRLERSLANFMIDSHTKDFGFCEVSPNLLVKSQAMYGTGQLPKFAEDSFETTDGLWLISTAEIPLTNIVADKIVDHNSLPFRYVAHTPCFRSEAGSAGKDTRGMIRLHQFNKVELVIISDVESAHKEYEYLMKAAETILQKLELPYRKVLLCGGDTGFGSKKTYDLEVWLPSQDCYREISSCSIFGDWQARRMNSRYKKSGDKETTFLYTMNGSGLAVGRTIVAILENYQNEDGTIEVPKLLQQSMGTDIIGKA